MRATQHSSRTRSNGAVIGTAHNDRRFDVEKAENIREGAKNIYLVRDEERHKIVPIGEDGPSFDEVEKRFYERHLSADLERQNQRAIKAGHKERVQTMDEYRTSRKHCPEEVIIQLGNADVAADRDVFVRCVDEYLREMIAAGHGHLAVLDVAVHLDESTPHCHIRRAWVYEEDGLLRIGQEKALQAAGYSPMCLREGHEGESKYNNRKIAFDHVMREKWLDIAERHGLQIEREPVPDGKHNRSKEDFIRDKLADAAEVLRLADRAREVLEQARQQGILMKLPRNVALEVREVMDALDRIGEQKERVRDVSLDDWER